MDKQKVLITGATSGIGLSLFKQYFSLGLDVIACGRNQTKLTEIGEQAYKTCRFDITDKNDVYKASNEIDDDIDILILNAGDCRYIDDVKQFDGDLFADVINTNLISLGWLLQAFLNKVKKGGQLVLVSSSATILPFPRSEAYGASKAGMDYLANSLRIDLAQESIGVTLVHPGFIKTPLTDKNDFAMPFIISSEQAAKKIINGVHKRRNYLHFPKRLTLLLKILSFLPSSIWLKMMTKDK